MKHKEFIIYGLYAIFGIGILVGLWWIITEAGNGNVMAIVVITALFTLLVSVATVAIMTGSQYIMFMANARENSQIMQDQFVSMTQLNKAMNEQGKVLLTQMKAQQQIAPQSGVSDGQWLEISNSAFSELEE